MYVAIGFVIGLVVCDTIWVFVSSFSRVVVIRLVGLNAAAVFLAD